MKVPSFFDSSPFGASAWEGFEVLSVF